LEWFTIIEAVTFAGGILRDRIKKGEETKGQWQSAVEKLQEAILQTQVYAAALDRGEPQDLNVEQELIAKWRVVAAAFYGLDGSLSEKFQLNAQYWTDPGAWTHQQVVDAGIALQHIAELTRQLLREGKR
jgi:hypothetical protein